jgi:hypothetical protein
MGYVYFPGNIYTTFIYEPTAEDALAWPIVSDTLLSSVSTPSLIIYDSTTKTYDSIVYTISDASTGASAST